MSWTARLRLVAATLALVAAVVTGGLVTASLWPVTVETDYYAADVRLSPSWTDRSHIGTDTVVGSVSAQFAGIAPGVQVSPRVKPSITDLVASGNLDAGSLDVSPQERTRVITEAAVGVGLRFAAGGVLGLLLCLGVVRLRRRTLPHRRTVLGASLVTAVTLSTLGLSAWRTYDPDRLVELRSSGLLQLAIANRDLLDDVEQRADQATPYLRNLLALSTAMQQEYARRRRTTPPRSRCCSSPTCTPPTSTP